MTFEFIINVGHSDLNFMVKCFCLISWRPFDRWTSYFNIMRHMTIDLQNKCRSQWPIFNGRVSLPYLLKTFWMMKYIVWDNSQCDMTFDLKINVGHSDLYFMVQWFCPISWRLWMMNIILWDSQCDKTFVLKINVTYISWSSDFALYLDCLMDEHRTLRLWVHVT